MRLPQRTWQASCRLINLASMILTTCLISHGNIEPQTLINIRHELSQPLNIQLSKQRQIQGHITDTSSHQIEVTTSIGAGEAIQIIERSQIVDLNIPGESYKSLALEYMQTNKHEEAYILMDLLFEQRQSLLPLLPPADSHFFVYYARLILDSPEPARAIAVADRLRPQIQNPKALHALNDAILESYYNIELYEKARPLAQEWIKARPPYGDSALGYFVMAADDLRAERYQAAIETALRPIIASSATPVDKLADCYAIAIGAALSLREVDHAITLYRELEERQLAWPLQDRMLQPYHRKLLKQLNQQ